MRPELSEFFGYTYDTATFDCVDLTLAVQRKLFGRDFQVPSDRMAARRQQRAIIRTHLVGTTTPRDGDVVLMRDPGRHNPDHIGTWMLVGGEPCVLHTTERTDTVITPVRTISDLGITIEGTYTWRT